VYSPKTQKDNIAVAETPIDDIISVFLTSRKSCKENNKFENFEKLKRKNLL